MLEESRYKQQKKIGHKKGKKKQDGVSGKQME